MGDVPRSDRFDDVYFSADDGPGETAHVFFDGNNLPQAWQGRDRFVIGETGFGTGLNFLLAWDLFDRTADQGAFLDFVSVEKYPLNAEEIRRSLSPWADRLSPYLEKMLAQYPIRVPGFHRMVFDNRVALTLIFDDANDALAEVEGSIDAWFLDGFTPAKNPDMWTDKVFGEMARLSHSGTSFATFTAAGFVKRGLQSAGFIVEKKDGFGRKRDMLAGVYAGNQNNRTLPSSKNVNILGAGLAGTSCHWVLKQYGFNPLLYDPNGIASAASGNPVGIINPRFTAFRTAESDFYTAGFAQAARIFPFLNDVDYTSCGSLHLVNDDDKEKRFTRTIKNWRWHADHMQYLSAPDASEISGITLDKPALYLPDSGQINPADLCRAYAQDAEIMPPPQTIEGPTIFAKGAGFLSDPDFSWLPLETVRGQITYAKATAALKTNLCYGGYISAPINGSHVIGSTFQKWMADTTCTDEDDQSNLANLADHIPAFPPLSVTGHRAALRTSSKDRFPIVGAVPGSDHHYITTAHGSHGLLSTLASAHLLADFLRGGPFSLPKSTIESLSPQRFANRALRRGGLADKK